MITERWNPERPGVEETVANLNRCFGGGWDRAAYRWYMARPFDGRTPDRVVVFDDGRPLAGSVVNYRQLCSQDGSLRHVGIATGSWTLPEARGQGLFTRMMQASVARAGEKGCDYFLAFVTRDNASRRALERCGAAMLPASYVAGGDVPVTAAAPGDIEAVDASPDELFARTPAGPQVRFHYGSAAEWAEQHLRRALPVEVLRIHGEYAIVEKAADTDRLQWTSADPAQRPRMAKSLAARATAGGRKFFMYRTDGTAVGEGLVARPGYVCCLPTLRGHPDPSFDLGSEWDVQSGDRM